MSEEETMDRVMPLVSLRYSDTLTKMSSRPTAVDPQTLAPADLAHLVLNVLVNPEVEDWCLRMNRVAYA